MGATSERISAEEANLQSSAASIPATPVAATVASFQHHPSRKEQLAQGAALREKCPRHSHEAWKPAVDRPDPLKLVEQSDQGRILQLLPIRHGRMIQSPFTFYRASALNMAVDVGRLPTTNIRVQACGDAHLGNFLCFATPERRVIFDIHDLDETLPAPWEWDVKRLAVSFVLAARDNGIDERRAKDLVLTCTRSYRREMRRLSTMTTLDVWYHSFDAESLVENIADRAIRKRAQRRIRKAKSRAILEYDFPKLVSTFTEQPKIRDNPPLIYHWRDHGADQFTELVQDVFSSYRASLSVERRSLLDQFELRDVAMKVVGVGSVGTFCAILLLMARDEEPLFLQVKEAGPSVLEPYAGKSVYANHGERVVHGHRYMQSASDLFLGWTKGRLGRNYYIRQLRDTKIKFAIESFGSRELEIFAKWCGATLARAHARSSGSSAVIAGYLGKSDRFDRAIATFSKAYADQVEQDYSVLVKAARQGTLDIIMEREA